MKILFLVSSMNAGGAERVAATLTSAWAERGHSVTLGVTYPQSRTCFYPLERRVKVVWLADHIAHMKHRLLKPFGKLHALRQLVKREQPDVIISFLTNVNVMALLATRGMGVPIIVCERTNPAVSRSARGMLSLLRRFTYPWADLVTVQAQASVAPFRKMVGNIKALEVVPNPLPSPLLEANEAVRGPDSQGRQRLMAMGRFVAEKQFDLMIRAFAALASEHPDWDLVIWGDGPLRADLVAQIKNSGLASRIFLPGRTETPWEELIYANAFAMTSSVEGFPNVLLEAMSLGLPCIAVDCPSGPREITRNGEDALLVPLCDEQAFVAGLKRLLSDPVLRDELANRSAQSVRQRYALPVVLALWDTLIETTGVSTASPALTRKT